ncbi:MAG: bifunctional UDP-N-acetylglucosamine diphosphorylase/glucosamine-1-phosphate N-acetyltransferase GlmU [Chloroflexota bacterium]|nr:bifunctional UDP-N-acetylglucosamine diphosphorylase/glucosamine-1-phosphate N-acetyltransferase GlmU [Chloroflexota bacterium]
MRTANVILAAGSGTRMKSDLPKVLHPLLGRPMVAWTVEMAEAVGDQQPVLVVGHGKEQVKALLGDRAEFVEQKELLGTGHAVQQAAPVLQGRADAVVVTYGDMPLLRAETVRSLVDLFARERQASVQTALAMLTVVRDDPQGFGRVVRDAQGEVVRIVEEADCTPQQRALRELNPGIYCFDAEWLWQNLGQIPLSAKGEYYLTDMVGMAVEQGRRVVATPAPLDEVNGINTRVHLAEAAQILRYRVLEAHMLAGVTVVDPAATYVDAEVRIGRDSVLLPGVMLEGDTQIGEHAQIGPYSRIVNSRIGSRCRVQNSVVEDTIMEDDCQIGPFGHLRKGAHLGCGVHMGNFGEVKNSYLAPGVKMGHFSYLGDAQVGENVNIGAGTITCNYDGARKHRTVIGEGVFIGSDTLLVAPVEVGEGAKTGAGAVVTHDVPPHTVVVGVPARPMNPKPHTGERSKSA